MAVHRPSLRTSFIAVVVTIAAIQVVAVTLAALPPNRYSNAVDEQTAYLDPYFTQNWRLFAPNPVSEDRSVRFQGSYVSADGTPTETAWVDWTAVELDLVHHRIVGGRAGYVTNKLSSSLQSRAAALTDAQRRLARSTPETAPPSWSELRALLDTPGSSRAAALAYVRYEQATTRLATDVLESRWPDRDFTAVRYEIRRQGVTPFADRHGSEAERETARPPIKDSLGGWRVPSPGPASERRSVADFDRRHR